MTTDSTDPTDTTDPGTRAEHGSLAGRWVLAVDSREPAAVADVLRDVNATDAKVMGLLLLLGEMAAELAQCVHGERWRQAMRQTVTLLDAEATIEGVDLNLNDDRGERC